MNQLVSHIATLQEVLALLMAVQSRDDVPHDLADCAALLVVQVADLIAQLRAQLPEE